MQGAGLDRALPYLLLAPSVVIVLAVLVYPLWDGLRASAQLYRYGRPIAFVGLDNYWRLWSDPQFLNALWVTVRFVALRRGASRRCSGSRLRSSACASSPASGCCRTVLIIPMVITPVVVGDRLSPDLRERRRHDHHAV